ncbi:MAG: ribonuclease III [Acidobacteriaceae bacterium]|nr:ribonuclease III [Acidobacteriaceae bacterium]MBV9779875.1 ribonuclease III [Acidobacteriaceae bacterium]
MNASIGSLEEKIGYWFRDPNLLLRALTHRSWLSERGSPLHPEHDNEQFEFLGDSVLGFVVAESLVQSHPTLTEGQLSKWKGHLVSAVYLYARAVELDLGHYLRLGKGEARNVGPGRKTLLANAFEAVIAAIHVDGGIEAARNFVRRHVLGGIDDPDKMDSIGIVSHKSLLHERAQALRLPVPEYELVETSGPEHAKVFTIEARIGELASRGNGSSKKEAGQHAARLLLDRLKDFEVRGSESSADDEPTLSAHRAAD